MTILPNAVHKLSHYEVVIPSTGEVLTTYYGNPANFLEVVRAACKTCRGYCVAEVQWRFNCTPNSAEDLIDDLTQ